MTRNGFIEAVERGKSRYYRYATEKLEGMISVWKHEQKYVVTWEECPPGQQYDESTYTRDDVFHFTSTDDLLKFLADSQIPIDHFEP